MQSSYSIMVAFAAAMGGLLFGYEIGVIGQVLGMTSFQLFMGGEIKTLDSQNRVIFTATDLKNSIDGNTTFVFLFGCAIGAIIVSFIADPLGRKKCIIGAGSFFLLGSAIQSLAMSTSIFYLGRLLAGCAIGVLSMVVPLFISETSPTAIRGRMIAIQQLMIATGILIASLVNTVIIKHLQKDNTNQLEWRIALGMQMVPAVGLVLINISMPESPRWLAKNGYNIECLGILARLFGEPVQSQSVQFEYIGIKDGIREEKLVGNGSWREILSPGILGRTVRAFILQAFQQWTGINVILYYQTELLQGMGLDKAAATTTFTIINNTINVLGTFPGMYMIERAGRRTLLVLGGLGMGITHYSVGFFLGLGNEYAVDGKSSYFYFATIAVWIFLIFFSSTWGPTPWVYQSGLFLLIRNLPVACSFQGNWGCHL